MYDSGNALFALNNGGIVPEYNNKQNIIIK